MSPKRPTFAFLLQFVCLTGGLGYLYLGQWARGLKLLGVLLLLHAAVAWGSTAGIYSVGMALAPVIFTLQALSALDAWLLAKQRNETGEALENKAAALPAMRWI